MIKLLVTSDDVDVTVENKSCSEASVHDECPSGQPLLAGVVVENGGLGPVTDNQDLTVAFGDQHARVPDFLGEKII